MRIIFVIAGWGDVLVGLLAALLWLRASRVDTKALAPGAETVLPGHTHIIAVIRDQSRWNKYAAIATAVGVMVQVLLQMAPPR